MGFKAAPGVRVQGGGRVGVPRGASSIRPRARDTVNEIELDFEERVKICLEPPENLQ